jgi:hypothetical protein
MLEFGSRATYSEGGGEQPLKMFNSEVLKEIFEPKRNEITEAWLELLHYLYFTPFIIRVIK